MPRPSSLLYLSPERVLYRGPLGQPSVRTLGAAACYVSLHGTLSLATSEGQAWHQARALCVPAGVPHQVATTHGHVVCYLVEQGFCNTSGIGAEAHVVAHGDGQDWDRIARLCAQELRAWRDAGQQADAELDRLVFGQALPARQPDPRIADVLRRIRTDPALSWLAGVSGLEASASAARSRPHRREPHAGGAVPRLPRRHPLQPRHPADHGAAAQRHHLGLPPPERLERIRGFPRHSQLTQAGATSPGYGSALI